ncbi:hypothetical protein EVAR_101842_1 [Eumeta japonica]|uniref:Uncharacterized protein n=1 Tax=Eumeta variegata TaxID=151549 RepID=A0A4C1SMR9_EUMVA|nr:hypothetical protein EVAR_101842_1 [Eumeta japonica]
MNVYAVPIAESQDAESGDGTVSSICGVASISVQPYQYSVWGLFDMYKPSSAIAVAFPPRFAEKRPVTCYTCDKQEYVASTSTTTSAFQKTNQASKKAFKL